MENDCHMILEQFPNYETGMDLAEYCFHIHREKNATQDLSPQMIGVPKYVPPRFYL